MTITGKQVYLPTNPKLKKKTCMISHASENVSFFQPVISIGCGVSVTKWLELAWKFHRSQVRFPCREIFLRLACKQFPYWIESVVWELQVGWESMQSAQGKILWMMKTAMTSVGSTDGRSALYGSKIIDTLGVIKQLKWIWVCCRRRRRRSGLWQLVWKWRIRRWWSGWKKLARSSD